jgi:hypothetical protein
MSTMISEIYDALREAGASEEKARKAAEVLANFDSRHQDVKDGFAAVRDEFAALKHEFAVIKGEFNTVKWMLATNLTLTLLVLGKLFLR